VKTRIFILLLLPAIAAAAPPPVITDDELRAEVRHARATVIITHILEKYHYRNKPLDDDLSGRILNTYLDSLDGNRSFFLDRDIKDFERYRYLLDDALDTPDLDPAFDIFKVYRQRVVERTDYADQLLDNGFDFSIDEDYVFDRQETDWAQTGTDLDETWRKKVKNDYLMLLFADKEDGEIKDILRKRYARLRTSAFQLNSNDVFQMFINSYATAIEPHTFYFTPRSSENFDITMRLSLEGIGAVLRAEYDYTVVQKIIPGGPAELGGELREEDRIIGVGQGVVSGATDHGGELGAQVAHGPAEGIANGGLVHVQPDVVVGRAIVVMGHLVEAVKTQNLHVLTTNLAKHLYAQALVRHELTIFQGNFHWASVEDFTSFVHGIPPEKY